MEIGDIEKVIATWQNEYKELSSLPFINNIQIFENRGDIMGCSNPHPHGQIWAQTSIPKEINLKTNNFNSYFNKHSETLLEAYINQEIKENQRIVYSNNHFLVVIPFWAVWPFETMIIPRKGAKNILALNAEAITAFADAIKSITSTYDTVFNVPFPYSAGIHQAPCNDKPNMGWH